MTIFIAIMMHSGYIEKSFCYEGKNFAEDKLVEWAKEDGLTCTDTESLIEIQQDDRTGREYFVQESELISSDSLTAQPEPKYVVSVDLEKTAGYNVSINGCVIDEKVFEDQMVGYLYEDRSDLIENIQCWLCEARRAGRTGDAIMMDEDIDYLKTLKDNYIFNSVSTNEYIAFSDNADKYNEICEAILAEQVELLKNELIGKSVDVLPNPCSLEFTGVVDNVSFNEVDGVFMSVVDGEDNCFDVDLKYVETRDCSQDS